VNGNSSGNLWEADNSIRGSIAPDGSLALFMGDPRHRIAKLPSFAAHCRGYLSAKPGRVLPWVPGHSISGYLNAPIILPESARGFRPSSGNPTQTFYYDIVACSLQQFLCGPGLPALDADFPSESCRGSVELVLGSPARTGESWADYLPAFPQRGMAFLYGKWQVVVAPAIRPYAGWLELLIIITFGRLVFL